MALTIAKVLCTTDFSDLSLEGIEYALNFAKQFGAEVRILHVYGLPTYLAAPDGAIIPTATLATARSDEAQRQLDETVAKYADRGVTIDGCLRVGITHDEVVSQAQEWGADVIVMASHGHSGITHAILGSVTERVLRVSRCPVLVVRKNDVQA